MRLPSAVIARPRDLDDLGEQLVTTLGGVWNRRRGQGLCRCPAHDDRSPSLSIRVGDKSLLYHCFAGCDSLDVIRAIRDVSPHVIDHGVPGHPDRHQDNGEWLTARIHELWNEACTVTETPAEIYLRKRGIPLANSMIRYHARTPLGSRHGLTFRPAMLSAVRDGHDLLAIQRTFLDPGEARRARDLAHPRRMLGQPGRGCVRLGRTSDTLGLAEGVESAWSAMILFGFPVWATLGNERFALVDIPLSVRRLILLADNDRAGRLAVAAAEAAHAGAGRVIETLWPWHGLNDWNDVLREEGKGAGDRARHAA